MVHICVPSSYYYSVVFWLYIKKWRFLCRCSPAQVILCKAPLFGYRIVVLVGSREVIWYSSQYFCHSQLLTVDMEIIALDLIWTYAGHTAKAELSIHMKIFHTKPMQIEANYCHGVYHAESTLHLPRWCRIHLNCVHSGSSNNWTQANSRVGGKTSHK